MSEHALGGQAGRQPTSPISRESQVFRIRQAVLCPAPLRGRSQATYMFWTSMRRPTMEGVGTRTCIDNTDQGVEGDPDALGRSLVLRRKLRADEGECLRSRRKKHRARATTRGRRAGTRYERGALVTMTGRRERRRVGTTRRCHLQILTDETRLAGMAARLREPAWAR